MRLLIVEDDDRGARYLVRGLSESGHIVDRAADGETGLALALEGIYDVLVVDRRLPGLDGIALVQRLREQGIAMPVSMLSTLRMLPIGWQGFAPDARTTWRSHTPSPKCWPGWKVLRVALTRRARRQCCTLPI